MNPHQPLPVSVIVAVRNGANHLPGALDSLLTQQPPPSEILVIDGHSSDGSDHIAASLPGVTLHRQSSLGLGAARNEGIQASRFPWIAFCDADDRWTPGSLAARTRALDASPATLAVVGRLIRIELANTSATPAQRERRGVPVPGFTPGALLAHRTLFTRLGGFDESLTIGTDTDWFVRLEQSGQPAKQIEDVVLLKGTRDTSLSTNVDAYRRELLLVARRFLARRKDAPVP